jgi:chitinase
MFKALYERIVKLREKNPELKILISVGGWFAKSTPFNMVLANDMTRHVFVSNVMKFLKEWDFDGLGKSIFAIFVNFANFILT